MLDIETSLLSIIIVGAGIVVASTALALQQDGHRVTLIDCEAPCAGASFGNQHLSMTSGPLTGLAIADLVAGRDPGIDVSA